MGPKIRENKEYGKPKLSKSEVDELLQIMEEKQMELDTRDLVE